MERFIKGKLKLLTMGNLEGKLEVVKMLKEEYGIGSQDAWKYLKVQKEVDRIHKESGALEAGISSVEVANTIYRYHRFIDHLFYANGISSDEVCLIDFLEPINYAGLNNKNLIEKYAKWRERFRNNLESNGVPINDDSELVSSSLSFFSAIRDILQSNEEAGFFKEKKFNLNDFLDGSIARKFFKVEEGNDKYLRKIIDLKNNKLSPEEIATLADDFDDVFSYKFSRKTSVVELKYLYKSYNGMNAMENYNTAKNERTLRKMDSQRRIALNYIISGGFESVEESLSMLKHELADSQKYISSRSQDNLRQNQLIERLGEEEGKTMFEILNRNFTKSLNNIVDFTKYTIHAIVSNRSWLEKMLKH